jgi:hypothetical protein
MGRPSRDPSFTALLDVLDAAEQRLLFDNRDTMPLPDVIMELLRRHGIQLSHERWGDNEDIASLPAWLQAGLHDDTWNQRFLP